MSKAHKNYCCECGARVAILNTGALRVIVKNGEPYRLCLECLIKQPIRPKWHICKMGYAALKTT
jgi:hypothetical protein